MRLNKAEPTITTRVRENWNLREVCSAVNSQEISNSSKFLKALASKGPCATSTFPSAVDESPHCYKRPNEVLAAHSEIVKILHMLTPGGVAMAGVDEFATKTRDFLGSSEQGDNPRANKRRGLQVVRLKILIKR